MKSLLEMPKMLSGGEKDRWRVAHPYGTTELFSPHPSGVSDSICGCRVPQVFRVAHARVVSVGFLGLGAAVLWGHRVVE